MTNVSLEISLYLMDQCLWKKGRYDWHWSTRLLTLSYTYESNIIF